MPIKMKVYTHGPETLVAAADAELMGKTFREGEIRIQVTSFYDGDVVDEEWFLKHLQLATIGNFVGRETVDAAVRGGFVNREAILWIDGVPHAQFVVAAQ